MDENLDRIVSTGYPEQGGGGKSRFVFSCPSCGGRIVTQNEYETGERGAMRSVLERQAEYGLASIFYRIPVVGYLIGGLVSRKIMDHRGASNALRGEETRSRAFNEVRDQFSRCEGCASYACPSCFSDGLCGICRQTGDTRRRVSDAQRETGGSGDGREEPRDPTKMWD